jgi:hypothetical protein
MERAGCSCDCGGPVSQGLECAATKEKKELLVTRGFALAAARLVGFDCRD